MRHLDIDDIHGRDPALLRRFAALMGPLLRAYFRPVVRGLERIPAGAGLYVGNHSGCMLTPDTFVWGLELFERRGLAELPFGLAHEVALAVPGIRQLLVPLGAVRASHENAARVFAAGHKALVYPGGDYDGMRAYRDRNKVVFGPRRGYLRLALRHGVPIIPVVAAGGHETLLVIDDGQWLARWLRADRWLRVKVWPIALSVPWGLTIGPMPPHLPLPTRIFVEVLEPIVFERQGEAAAADHEYVEACHARVLGAMQPALERLAAERVAAGGKRLL